MTTSSCTRCGGPADYGGAYCTGCECPHCHGRDPACTSCGGSGAAPADSTPLGTFTAALLGSMYEQQVLAEAEAAAAGLYPVAIAPGDCETEKEHRLVFTDVPALAAQCGTVQSRLGGNDYSVYVFAGPDAEASSVAFMAGVVEVAPSWWRITPGLQPCWR